MAAADVEKVARDAGRLCVHGAARIRATFDWQAARARGVRTVHRLKAAARHGFAAFSESARSNHTVV